MADGSEKKKVCPFISTMMLIPMAEPQNKPNLNPIGRPQPPAQQLQLGPVVTGCIEGDCAMWSASDKSCAIVSGVEWFRKLATTELLRK